MAIWEYASRKDREDWEEVAALMGDVGLTTRTSLREDCNEVIYHERRSVFENCEGVRLPPSTVTAKPTNHPYYLDCETEGQDPTLYRHRRLYRLRREVQSIYDA